MAFELFPIIQWFDNSGNPLAGGKVYTYAAGTLTPQATYTDSTGGTPNSNPVVLDSAGRAQIWFSPASYKLILKTSADVTLMTIDNVTLDNLAAAISSLTMTGDLAMQQATAATSGANQNSQTFRLQSRYWTGSADATDTWSIQVVMGAGANPSSTLTFSHAGSSGSATVSWPSMTFSNLTVSGNVTAGSETVTGNETIGGTLAVTGSTTLNGGTLNGTFGGAPTLSGSVAVTGSLTASGNVTETAGQNQYKAYNFNSVIWLDGIKYTSLAAAYAAIPVATFAASGDGIGTVWTGGGGVVEVPPGWIDPAWSANLVLKNCASIHFNGPAYFNQGSFQVTAAGNVHGVSITNSYGDHSQRTSGVTFDYSGNGDAWAIGDGGNNTPVSDIRIENIQIHSINGGLASNALHIHGSQYCNFLNLDLVVANGATNTGNGLLLDGTGTGVFNNQNIFQGLTINFSNNPVSFTGACTDNIYIGGLIGNPHGTGGPGFSIAGSSTRNLFLNTAILSGTFASLYNFGGTANGNEVFAANGQGFATLTVVFGAGSSNNVYHCIGGTLTGTDSGTGNSVYDPTTFKVTSTGKIQTYAGLAAADFGLAPIVGTPIHLTGQTANLAATDIYTAPVSGLYMLYCHARTTTSGTGTTATMSFTYADEGGAKTATSGTWALNSVTITGTGSMNYPAHISAGTAIKFSVTGTFGTSVYAVDAWVMRIA